MAKKTAKKAAKKTAAKKTAKKAVKKTAKKAVKKSAKKAPKKAASKATKKAKTAKKAANSRKVSHEQISLAAYSLYMERISKGIPGDQHSDWVAAEQSLVIKSS